MRLFHFLFSVDADLRNIGSFILTFCPPIKTEEGLGILIFLMWLTRLPAEDFRPLSPVKGIAVGVFCGYILNDPG